MIVGIDLPPESHVSCVAASEFTTAQKSIFSGKKCMSHMDSRVNSPNDNV